jgi:hypothetical protein
MHTGETMAVPDGFLRKSGSHYVLRVKGDSMIEEQIRDGAHLLDVCVDYVGRDGVADMREIVGRFATASTIPLVIDSTEPPVVEAALEFGQGGGVVEAIDGFAGLVKGGDRGQVGVADAGARLNSLQQLAGHRCTRLGDVQTATPWRSPISDGGATLNQPLWFVP